MLIGEEAEQLTLEEREAAVDEVLELGRSHRRPSASADWNEHRSLERASGRTFTDAEKEEITTHTQRAWRWTFLVSGLQHPNIVRAIGELTSEGSAKIETPPPPFQPSARKLSQIPPSPLMGEGWGGSEKVVINWSPGEPLQALR